MLREFAHLRATRFQSTPKAFGVGPTAKMALLHGRLIRADPGTQTASQCAQRSYPQRNRTTRGEDIRGADGLESLCSVGLMRRFVLIRFPDRPRPGTSVQVISKAE